MELNENATRVSATPPSNDASVGETRVWQSEQILGDKNEVLIIHGQETYRLRRTRLGKLILQK